MHIQEILSKYEPCYKGGSGYNFLVNVDDFNALVKHLEQQQEDIDLLVKKVDEQLDEIKEHCETKGLAGRQVFALTKRVDELVEENEQLKSIISIGLKRVQQLEKERD